MFDENHKCIRYDSHDEFDENICHQLITDNIPHPVNNPNNENIKGQGTLAVPVVPAGTQRMLDVDPMKVFSGFLMRTLDQQTIILMYVIII